MGFERLKAEYAGHVVWTTTRQIEQKLQGDLPPITDDHTPVRDRILILVGHLNELSQHWNQLVTKTALDSLQGQLHTIDANLQNTVSNNNWAYVVQVAANIDAACGQVASWLPVKDRYLRGTVAAAEAFAEQSSAAVNEVRERIDAAVQEVAESASAIEGYRESIKELADNHGRFATEIESRVATQVERLDNALNDLTDKAATAERERSEVFERAQREHSERVERAAEDLRKRFEDDGVAQAARGQEVVESLKDLEQQAKNLVNAVGFTATATDYGKHAEAEKKTANTLRRLAVGAFGCSFLWVLGSVFFPNFAAAGFWAYVVVRLGGAVALLGAGVYLARESAHHRNEERAAKSKQLDLAALDPFIVTLPEDRKQDIKAAAARRLFAERENGTADQSSGHPIEDVTKIVLNILTAQGILPK